MKKRFYTVDVIAVVTELQGIKDSRVNQIYDIDNKTYLFKLTSKDTEKIKLLIESGIRIHTTKCEWPKNPMPSNFTMKLRKHIVNKRITDVSQVGQDRIINIQFGSREAAYHLIVEFFNKGNIVLTDNEYIIIALIRSYSDGENHRFSPHEKYPVNQVKKLNNLTVPYVQDILRQCKGNGQIKKCLLPHVELGQSFLEHCLTNAGINPELKLNSFQIDNSFNELLKLIDELSSADLLVSELKDNKPKGFISYLDKSTEKRKNFIQMIDFNPYLFSQNKSCNTKVFDSFVDAVDEYFSKLESQKMQLNALEKEEHSMNKVKKIQANQESRLQELSQKQHLSKTKAELILNNAAAVEEAIRVVRLIIASQLSWSRISDIIEEAKQKNDPIASCISKTKFEVNQISMMLKDPFSETTEEISPMEVDIDLSLSAHANAEKYFENKKSAAIKERKTLDTMNKALKSAEKKARELLKNINTQGTITIANKSFWFEKFYWFISSDNYIVIAGRDQKQNELLVKRYMTALDLYVHADLIGASSVVIKNPSGSPVPPRTLDEAGQMAVCYSNAWATKIICRAWWVYGNQVSKTPPSGEYLVTGSFMIRGQKNYLLPMHLQLGFCFLFKVEESFSFRHIGERTAKFPLEQSTKTIENPPVQDFVTEEEKIEIPKEDEPDELHSLPSSKINKVEANHAQVDTFGGETNCSKILIKNSEVTQANESGKLKRGQRSKLKKIKEKYKDQDEADKLLRMSILKSSGEPKIATKIKSKTAAIKKQQKCVQPISLNQNTKKETAATNNFQIDGENDVRPEINTDQDMLSLLTGQPHPEDELLQAIPVIAPYSAILNYKFKIKIVPGTTKRGKAARTALDNFLKLKDCTYVEKELLKSVHDQSLSRNFPGKVKLSTNILKKK